jgi:hypothetical protein
MSLKRVRHGSDICYCGDFRSQHKPRCLCGCENFHFAHVSSPRDQATWRDELIRQQAYAEAIETCARKMETLNDEFWSAVAARDCRALTPPAIPQREQLTGEKLREIAKRNCVVREVTWAMCRFNWDAIALKVEAFMRGDAITRELEGETRK